MQTNQILARVQEIIIEQGLKLPTDERSLVEMTMIYALAQNDLLRDQLKKKE